MTDLSARFREIVLLRRVEKRVRIRNRLTDEVQREYLNLRKTAEGRAALVKLLYDQSPSVRMATAVRVLAFAPEEARPIVELSAKRSDMLGFEAALVVKQYDGNKLALDWVPQDRPSRTFRTVSSKALDDALTLHGLVMSGGFAHAWAVIPETFPQAEQTLRTIGRSDAAILISAARKTLSAVDDPTVEDRAARLSKSYFALPDVQDSIEGVDAP